MTIRETKEPKALNPRKFALQYLSRREYSKQELIAKLESRGISRAAATEVAEQLEVAHLLSDRRFAEQLVSTRIRKGYGPFRIRIELQAKGIDAELINEVLALDDEVWNNLAKSVLQRHFGLSTPIHDADRARRMRYLQRRGFSSSQIRSCHL